MEDKIAQEALENLLSQLESFLGTKPICYLKFCSKEEYANSVLEGDLFSNTPRYFREKEKETGDRGQGDADELILALQTENILVVDNETGNPVFSFPKGKMRLRFNDDDSIPIVSFTGFTLREMKLVSANEKSATFVFPFSQEEYAEMGKQFGEYCVIIGARELEEKIASYCGNIDCEFIFDKVEYCSQNRIDRMQAFNTSSAERFLYKNEDLAYQHEYRMVLPIEMPADHYIRIGKLENAKLIPSSMLQNLAFSISYTSL